VKGGLRKSNLSPNVLLISFWFAQKHIAIGQKVLPSKHQNAAVILCLLYAVVLLEDNVKKRKKGS